MARGSLLAVFAALTTQAALAGQMVGPRLASRVELEAILDSLQQVATSATMGEEERRQLQYQISGVALRLQRGDITAGDQIRLTVTGEDKWTDQFGVTQNGSLNLPDIDPIPLAGRLYSEVETTIVRALGRYLREPRVRVDVLKRVGVLGQVNSPGFYFVPGDILVSDLIMQAGGPAGNADVNNLAFRRLGERIEADRPRVVWESQTLDELGLVSGDEVYVPEKKSFVLARVLGFLLAAAVSISFIVSRL